MASLKRNFNWHDMFGIDPAGAPLMSASTMADSDELSALRAENSRLIALLESHGIEWRARQQPSPPPVEPSRLSTDEKVSLFQHPVPRPHRRVPRPMGKQAHGQVGLRASLRE